MTEAFNDAWAVKSDDLCLSDGHYWHHYLGPDIPDWAVVLHCPRCGRISVDASDLSLQVKALRDYKRIEGDGVDALVWRSDVLAIIDGHDQQEGETNG